MTESTTPPMTPWRRIAWVFWNFEERRLRAACRLVIHLLLVFLLGLLLSAGFGLLVRLGLPDGLARLLNVLVPLVVITAATYIARRMADRRTFVSLGFRFHRGWRQDLLFGIALGGVLMALIFLFELAMGWLTIEVLAWERQPWSAVLGGLAFAAWQFLAVGYYEELFSRGYQLQNLAAGLNLFWGVMLSSALFGLLHLSNPNADWLSTFNIFLAGLFLALGYVLTRQLWIPIGLHIGWNFFQGPVFGFPVSGIGGFHLIQHTVRGPELITGGAFGPEAGLTGIAAMLLGSLLIWTWVRLRRGRYQAPLSLFKSTYRRR